MKIFSTLAAVALGAALLAGCSDPAPDATDAPATTPATTAPATSPATTPAKSPATTAPTPTTPTTSAPATPSPSTAPVSPTKVASSSGPSAALLSAREDVETIAPQLESYYRDREYPEDLRQVRQTLADADVRLSPGNSIGGYVYDGDAVEFQLCIQNTSGAWASYDTAPMTLRESGETGGCPS